VIAVFSKMWRRRKGKGESGGFNAGSDEHAGTGAEEDEERECGAECEHEHEHEHENGNARSGAVTDTGTGTRATSAGSGADAGVGAGTGTGTAEGAGTAPTAEMEPGRPSKITRSVPSACRKGQPPEEPRRKSPLSKIIIKLTAKSKEQIKTKSNRSKKRQRMVFDLPPLTIRTLSTPLPEGKIKARYKVGLSTITITGDQYTITDPYLSGEEKERLEKVASQLLFIMPTEAARDESAFREYLEEYGIADETLYYFLRREVLGYGVFDVLMQDDKIEDITAWPDTTSVNHKDFGTLRTNISLSEQDFNRYVEKFVHMAGKSVSLYNPLLSIRLPTNDRLTVTYQREVSDKPSFSIRKFPKQPWSITSIMMLGTLTPEMAAWLMLTVKYKRAILACGPIGSGKTSLINALCSLIPADQVVVTVEDTPELRLARQNWFSFITRESTTVEEKGEIRMFDLVKHALRQPASYIIVGEVRGEEGRVWAQAIATGHGGITSLHAETPEGAIERLRSDPINVAEGALRDLSIIIIMKPLLIRRSGSVARVRRVTGIYDLSSDSGNKKVEPICLFKHDAETDTFIQVADPLSSPTARKIAESVPIEKLVEEYRLYTQFLRHLLVLGHVYPELGSHTKVTELVWELYNSGKLPDELSRLEAALVESPTTTAVGAGVGTGSVGTGTGGGCWSGIGSGSGGEVGQSQAPQNSQTDGERDTHGAAETTRKEVI